MTAGERDTQIYIWVSHLRDGLIVAKVSIQVKLDRVALIKRPGQVVIAVTNVNRPQRDVSLVGYRQ